MKLRGHHFDKIEMTEAILQVVLNTFTKYGFQDAI
jgi:hypothetical protein